MHTRHTLYERYIRHAYARHTLYERNIRHAYAHHTLYECYRLLWRLIIVMLKYDIIISKIDI
jgi:hypothetical protein